MVSRRYRLDRTLACGQCFRWTVLDASAPHAANGPGRATLARGVVDGAVAVVSQQGAVLRVAWDGPPGVLERLRVHLGADAPLTAIEAALARDPVLRRLLPQTSGIAIMRQDPWECLVSYVISAFNNIPKIRTSIEEVARRFGVPIPGTTAWAFPRPERLAEARVEALRACLLGYRAASVRALARLVADGDVDLSRIGALPYAQAHQALVALPGVGAKVAECVLLFAYGIGAAFPVDVWVQRAVERWYFGGRTRTPGAIRAWARDRFGPLAGHAQQHLYAAARAARVR
ncbi:MAG: hypothetical protein QN203_07205 [Armatimonadota bacterium]|nr:hypothetical protein [Armatimonadota bacterium]